MQAYSRPTDASDPRRLPDLSIERFDRAPLLDITACETLASATAKAVWLRLAGRITDAIYEEAIADRFSKVLERDGHDEAESLVRESAEENARNAFALDPVTMPEPCTDAILQCIDDLDAGWYYCACLPGCMPDSDWTGPYESAQAATDAAREAFDSE